MRGGGSKAVWNFSESSSVLVASTVPNKIYPTFLLRQKSSKGPGLKEIRNYDNVLKIQSGDLFFGHGR